MDRTSFAYEELEVYRTAREFGNVCVRLRASLPADSARLREELARESGNLIIKIVCGAEDVEPARSLRAFQAALQSALRCATILAGLRAALLGDQACVLAGLELNERIQVGLEPLLHAR